MEKPSLEEKEVLNQDEAITYFNLSPRKTYKLFKQDGLKFLAYYGNRKLVLKSEFTSYLAEHPELIRKQRV